MRSIILTLMLIAALDSVHPIIDIGDKTGISLESGHIEITMPAENYCELFNISKEPLY